MQERRNDITEIALIKKQMENFDKNLGEFKKENKEAHDEIKIIIEKAMETKAGKWVERAIIWFMIFFATTTVAIIAYLLKITVFK